jgi:hypothetical protein
VRGSGRLPEVVCGERQTHSTVAKTKLFNISRKVQVEGSRNYDLRGGEIGAKHEL